MVKCLLTALLTFAYLAKADLTTFITSPAASSAATTTGTGLLDPLSAVLVGLRADIIPTSFLFPTPTSTATSTAPATSSNSTIPATSINSTTPATSIFQATATGETTPITRSGGSQNYTSTPKFTLELSLGLALEISFFLAAIIFFLYFRRRNSKIIRRKQITPPTSEESEPAISEVTHSFEIRLAGSGMRREFDVGIRTAGGGFDKAELPGVEGDL